MTLLGAVVIAEGSIQIILPFVIVGLLKLLIFVAVETEVMVFPAKTPATDCIIKGNTN
jgi:hypothetical protein